MTNPLLEAYNAFSDFMSCLPSPLVSFIGFAFFCFFLPLLVNALRGSK